MPAVRAAKTTPITAWHLAIATALLIVALLLGLFLTRGGGVTPTGADPDPTATTVAE